MRPMAFYASNQHFMRPMAFYASNEIFQAKFKFSAKINFFQFFCSIRESLKTTVTDNNGRYNLA